MEDETIKAIMLFLKYIVESDLKEYRERISTISEDNESAYTLDVIIMNLRQYLNNPKKIQWVLDNYKV